MIKYINTNGSSNPRNFILFEDILYFTAYNEQYGRELWKSDGTEVGTNMIMDIYAGSNSTFDWGPPADFFGEQIIVHNEMIYFTAKSEEYGYEIWYTDGTMQGTKILLDLNPGTNSSYPWWLTSFGDKLYFTAAEIDPYPTNGRQMYFYWDNPGPVIDV
jgi:ELWxxDGT repeat protein